MGTCTSSNNKHTDVTIIPSHTSRTNSLLSSQPDFKDTCGTPRCLISLSPYASLSLTSTSCSSSSSPSASCPPLPHILSQGQHPGQTPVSPHLHGHCPTISCALSLPTPWCHPWEATCPLWPELSPTQRESSRSSFKRFLLAQGFMSFSLSCETL